MDSLGGEGVRVFKDDEAGYQEWLGAHRSGYVLNAHRRPRASYLPLHTATCHTITEYRQFEGTPAFTGGDYIKICAERIEPLRAWIARLGASRFTTLCSSCHPAAKDLDDAEVERLRLANEVKRLQENPAALSAALSAPPEAPSYSMVQTKVFTRSAAVMAAVLNRAGGVCEACEQAAPFAKASDGSPYLEVHHKQPLARGGLDHPGNAEALCPNCHRKKHFG